MSDSLGADFKYYNPVNDKQKDFHKSTATNKLLIGAYRGGKTYPSIHEALFICRDNPGHEFAVFRNTQKSLESNVQKEFVKIATDAGAVAKNGWIKSKGDLTLKNGTVVKFRPLSTTRAQLKGMSLCGFLIDDPDVKRYEEVITFLFTRLTNPHGVKAKYFSTIICANYEGHDWLWKTYMRRKKQGGNGMFAYWFFQTSDNPTLEDNYIPIQKAIHSQAWMDRYINGDQNSHVGLIYDEYNPEVHDQDLSWIEKDQSMKKILIVDLGITHPTVVLKAATDYEKIYFYYEWFRTNIRTQDLGDHLLSLMNGDEKFDKIIIDPKSRAREQTSGVSPHSILKDDFGIRNLKLADNSMRNGIECQKGIMTIRLDKDGKPFSRFMMDPKACPNLARELETLSWKEPDYSSFDELAYSEEPMDKDNDATDCSRYGCMEIKRNLIGMRIAERQLGNAKKAHWEERWKKLKIYQKRPDVVRHQRKVLMTELHTQSLQNNRMAKMKRLHGKKILRMR